MLAAAILAAGESKRMGEPKALVPFRGLTFVERLYAATRLARIGITRVILGARAQEIRTKLKVDPSMIVVNPDWPKGQLSSIHAAIRSLSGHATEGLVVCPVDHPLVSLRLVAELVAQFDSSGKPIVLPTYRGKRGHPVIFRASLYDELLAAALEVGARQVVWDHSQDIKEVPTDEEGVILNLNDPETLKKVASPGKPA
ncbi:MAG: nucleotidyltransferase family protein [Candidatus Acidiferrales bacterium]